MRVCRCGCKRSLEGRRKSVLYFDARCRARASRARVHAQTVRNAPSRVSVAEVRFWSRLRDRAPETSRRAREMFAKGRA